LLVDPVALGGCFLGKTSLAIAGIGIYKQNVINILLCAEFVGCLSELLLGW